jgi:hypothetical protein
MKRTGVLMSKEVRKTLTEKWQTAKEMPVIQVGEVDAYGLMWERLRRAIHQAALDVGLPEITGLYGADLETGEFLESEEGDKK